MSGRNEADFYGWRLLALLCFVYSVLVGVCFYGTPMLFPLMVKELGWGRTEISLGFTTAVLSTGAGAPLAAWSIKQWGARSTMVTGCVLAALGCFLMTLATTVREYVFYFGILVGVGVGIGTVPVQSIVTFWFSKHRGLALGLVLSGGSLGGFIAPGVLTSVVAASGGSWRSGWNAIATLVLVAGVIALLFVRNEPSDKGQHADGIDPQTRLTGGGTGAGLPIHVIYRTDETWTVLQAVRTREFWFLTLTGIGVFFIWYVLLTQATMHLEDKGFSRQEYGMIYGITTGLTSVGRLGAGFLADRVDPTRIMTGSVVLSLIGSILFWFVTPANPVALSYPLFSGVAMGAAGVAMINIISNYWGVSAFASVYGALFPLITVFHSLAAPFAGFMYDRAGSYFYVMVSCWALLGCALVAMLLMKPPRRPLVGSK